MTKDMYVCIFVKFTTIRTLETFLTSCTISITCCPVEVFCLKLNILKFEAVQKYKERRAACLCKESGADQTNYMLNNAIDLSY